MLSREDKAIAAAGGRTKKISRQAVSEKHVRNIPSQLMSGTDKLQQEDGDTGPWYIGKTVGEIFDIRGVLGRGGMGIVYLAHDNATQKKVAIKVPLGKFVDDEGARKRFAREAEAWTGLIHPHIVHAFDVRDEQATDYRPAIFMDYCDGSSLKERIYNNKKLSMPDALDIAIQICWAMEFAHKKGHIHRDLKPGNILLTSDGKALVTDFGLVRMLEAKDLGLSRNQLTQNDAQALASISKAGGTPEYMPPEQWEGKAEKTSDIYAFGVMLYELFCGCRPFTAENRLDLRIPHMQVPPPDPKQMNGDIPNVLSELMLSCLSKRPGDRPTSFGEMADRLTRAYAVAAKRAKLTTKYLRTKPLKREISRADKEARAWALIHLGAGCRVRGDLRDTERQYARALAIFEGLGDKAGMGSCYNNMGLVARACGQYDRAMELYRKDLAISEELGYKTGVGRCYVNMGNVAYNRGQYDEAMELYRKSLAICEELGEKAGMGMCYTGMGLVARARGRYDEAMEMYRKDLAICEELGDKAGMGVCYTNMGIVSHCRGRYDEAMEMYNKSLSICVQLGDKVGMSLCYNTMGVVAADRGQYDEAMELYGKSLAICRELSDKAGMGYCYTNMGNVAYNRGQYDEAMKLYRKDLAICEELDDKAGMGDCYTNMTVLAQATGDDYGERAYAHKAVKILDDVGIPIKETLRKAARM